jgi:hypothetical protein
MIKRFHGSMLQAPPNTALTNPRVGTSLYNRLDYSEMDLTGKLKTPTRDNVFYRGIFLVVTNLR